MKKLFLLTIVAATTLMLQAQTISTASLNLMYCPEDYHLIEETVCNTLLNSKTWTIGTEIVGPFAIKDVDNDGKIKRSYSVEKASGCTTDYDLIVTVENCAPVAPEGAINGLFSVNSDGKQVFFSKGNLQWTYRVSEASWEDAYHDFKRQDDDNITPACPSCNEQGWGRFQFAENQWDIVSYTISGNPKTITKTGIWQDLFRSGTSTYDNKTPAFPTSKASSGNYITSWSSLHDCDWGQFNAIENGGNVPEMWRTLTRDEWAYVFSNRPNASSLWARAKVNNVVGVILLPDDWTWGIGDDEDLKPTTWNSGSNFTSPSNVYSGDVWSAMENAGAVFLPVTGYINYNFEKNYYATQTPRLIYQTSTVSSSKVNVYQIQNSAADNASFNTGDYLPVRLVHDAN